MKKLIVIALICMSSVMANAQENAYAKDRSTETSKYIVAEMSLSESQGIFLKKTLFNKYNSQVTRVNGKDLSQDEKSEIYNDINVETKKKLAEQFSEEQIIKIGELEQKKKNLK